MTAKELAKHLYDKFEPYAHQEDFGEAPMPFKEMWQKEAQSKHDSTINCCKIHIDEVVELINDPDLRHHYRQAKLELDNINCVVHG